MANQGDDQKYNIRKLAIAYASGSLDKITYRRLRASQLSALDFDRPMPNLPPEIAEIVIPTVKIEQPYEKSLSPMSVSSKGKLKYIVIFLILAAIAAGGYFIFAKTDILKSKLTSSTSEQTQSNKPLPKGLEGLAIKLMNKRIWTSTDIRNFTNLWLNKSDREREKARESEWFIGLEKALTKRIAELKALKEVSDDPEADQQLLNQLRLFYADLNT